MLTTLKSKAIYRHTRRLLKRRPSKNIIEHDVVPAAWPLLLESADVPKIHDQNQSALFNMLPLEIRVQIYEAALGDLTKPTHILHMEHRLSYIRCRFPEMECPTWQHWCCGDAMRNGLHGHHWAEPDNEKLLALILTCRLAYAEALDIIYKYNFFHFRMARSVSRFADAIPDLQWHAIKHLHISTMFWAPKKEIVGDSTDRWPPETLGPWERCCRLFNKMRGLQTLKVELFVRNKLWFRGATDVDNDTLICILQPLMGITVTTYEVELNIKIPMAVENALGPAPFNICINPRPYDANYI